MESRTKGRGLPASRRRTRIFSPTKPMTSSAIGKGRHRCTALHDGRDKQALELLEQALETFRTLRSGSTAVALINLAEACYVTGDLPRAAALLHECYSLQRTKRVNTSPGAFRFLSLLAAAAVAIPVGIMLADDALLQVGSDSSLLDVAFSWRVHWVLGPIIEAFCALYEFQGHRERHDTLLGQAADPITTLDISFDLGIRLARLGSAHHLPRISALMSRQCSVPSPFCQAYKDLFDAFLATRRRMPRRARERGLHAADEFRRVGRPFQHALALDAAGLHQEAQARRPRLV